MDVARNAMRMAGEGNAGMQGNAAQEAVMKLAGHLPGVDAGQLRNMGSEAWQKATEATKEGLGNLLSAAAWDPLGAPVVGTSGQISRDASNIFDTTLSHRAETQAEAGRFVKTFERRLTRAADSISHAAQKTEASCALVDACKEKASGIDRARDTAHAASKAIQSLLECEKEAESARDVSAEKRASELETRREKVRADLNARREKAEQDFKDQHAALLIKYKEPDTEDFI